MYIFLSISQTHTLSYRIACNLKKHRYILICLTRVGGRYSLILLHSNTRSQSHTFSLYWADTHTYLFITHTYCHSLSLYKYLSLSFYFYIFISKHTAVLVTLRSIYLSIYLSLYVHLSLSISIYFYLSLNTLSNSKFVQTLSLSHTHIFTHKKLDSLKSLFDDHFHLKRLNPT